MKSHHAILWTSTEASAVTGGKSTASWCAGGIAISMNDLRPGDLYVATQDDDLEAVRARGAAAVIVAGSRAVPEGLPALHVESVFDALMALGGAARFRTHATIISVQGRDARAKIHDVLAASATVHEGGRQVALGLASIPEDIDFGLFSASPAVQPDFAVITNCAVANRDTLFETMPAHGTVIINADDDAFLQVIARARAACITNIMTYGAGAGADARVLETVKAENGTRVRVNIMGEEHGFVLPPGVEFHGAIAAALLVLRLAHKPLCTATRALEGRTRPTLFENGVALIDPLLHGRAPRHAVFRVTNMIDLGLGRQTAILDTLTDAGAISFPKKDLAIPRKLASFNFVYTSKRVGAVANARKAIRELHGVEKIATITPSVLTPGDFLVFRDDRASPKAIFCEALRAVSGFKQRKSKLSHAV